MKKVNTILNIVIIIAVFIVFVMYRDTVSKYDKVVKDQQLKIIEFQKKISFYEEYCWCAKEEDLQPPKKKYRIKVER